MDGRGDGEHLGVGHFRLSQTSTRGHYLNREMKVRVLNDGLPNSGLSS